MHWQNLQRRRKCPFYRTDADRSGKRKHTLKEAEVKHILSETYGTIRPCVEKLGSGPAHYMEKLMDLKEKLDLSVQFHINSAVDVIVSA